VRPVFPEHFPSRETSRVEGGPLGFPLPLDKDVEYVGQILEALDAALRKGSYSAGRISTSVKL
jgi:hypothetical protein